MFESENWYGNNERYDALIESISFNGKTAPVPEGVLRALLLGSKNPETMADEPGFSLTPTAIATVLKLAEAENKNVNDKPKFIVSTDKKNFSETPLYIASAGGPGAGKSTALLQYVAEIFDVAVPAEWWVEPSLSKAINKIFFGIVPQTKEGDPDKVLDKKNIPAVLVSPDRRGILSLALEMRGQPTSDREFYLEYRAASNFLSNFVLNAAFHGKRGIVHDTTLSSPAAVNNLMALRNAGYFIGIFMQGAPLNTREEAADERNKVFFQSLKSNVTAQDEVFAKQLPEIVALSHHVVVGWRDGKDEPSKTVAKIYDGRHIHVSDVAGFEKYCAVYPQMAEVCKGLNRLDLHPDPLGVKNLGEAVYCFNWLKQIAENMGKSPKRQSWPNMNLYRSAPDLSCR